MGADISRKARIRLIDSKAVVDVRLEDVLACAQGRAKISVK